MIKPITTLALLILVFDVQAGTFADGTWSATHCGSEPANPTIDSGSVDAYNDSLKEVKDWQQKAQTYNNCVVNEANADNESIAKAANAQQDRFRAAVAEISATANAAKAKLDHKK